MNDLIKNIEQWATDRNLHTADPAKQMLKLFEEIGEIASGMARGNTDEIKDGIGDVKVVTTILKEQLKNVGVGNMTKESMVMFLIIYDIGMLAREFVFKRDIDTIKKQVDWLDQGLIALSDVNDTTLETCTELAYIEIKDRKGRLVNGTFIKESDLK